MIVVFGAVCIDRVRRVERLAPMGGYVEVREESIYLGGEAANTANALKSWEREVRLVGNEVGQDPFGSLLREALNFRHLDCPEAVAGAETPVCDIYVTPDGERTMYGWGFERMRPSLDIDSLGVSPGHWFTAEPNMAEASRSALRLAHQAGCHLYMMDFYRSDEWVPEGAYWQCSTDWVGRRGDSKFNRDWLQRWADRHGCFGILSDAANGFIAGGPDYPLRHYPAFPTPKVVDSTGSGDVFRAGMLYGLDQGWSLADSLRFASVAGSLECQYLGATARVPSVAEIEAHIASHPSIAAEYE